MNAAEPYLDILAASPHRLAVCEPGGRSITYSDLRRRVIALAQDLREQGFTAGDRALMLVPNGVEFAASALAVFLLGGTPVLLEPGLGDPVFLSRVKAAGPKWLLLHPLLAWIGRIPGARALLKKREIEVPPIPKLPGMRTVIVSPKKLDRLQRQVPEDATFEIANRDDSDDGILVFTGGTTSAPKGVRLCHGALSHYLSHISSAITGMHLENFLADTPQQVLYALRLGKTAYTTKGRTKKRAATVHSLATAGKVDAYFGSPYVWMEMMASGSGGTMPATLKTVLLGGAPVTREFLRLLRNKLHSDTKVLVLYGMTEAGPVCAVSAEDKLAYTGEGDLVGAPLHGVTLEIDGGGEIGEVIVQSPSLYSGYLHDTERGDEGFRTGDLGQLIEVNTTQMLLLLGRRKDMIIRAGVNIYPASFEENLRAIKNNRGDRLVREAAMIGVWNPATQDEAVVLCIEPLPGADVDRAALEKDAASVCGIDARPDHLLVLDAIPVTGRQNKVDKNALRQIAVKRLGLELMPDHRPQSVAGAQS